MRIISGKYGRRRFSVPTNITARPTTDFARENLFNVLENILDFDGLRALDLFAGTGAISFSPFLSSSLSNFPAAVSYPIPTASSHLRLRLSMDIDAFSKPYFIETRDTAQRFRAQSAPEKDPS